MPRSEQTLSAYLALASSRRIVDANLNRLEAAFINGTTAEIELARSDVQSAVEAQMDRLWELVWQQMTDEGINPNRV